jgi:hypothetical protein
VYRCNWLNLYNISEQFGQSGNIVIKPAYVTISGPSERINKIRSWRTDSLVANGVNESFKRRPLTWPHHF